MHSVKLENWSLWIEDGSLPDIYSLYIEHADFVDEIDMQNPEGKFCFLGIREGVSVGSWPSTVVTQKYKDEGGFNPGILVVPDTSLVFVGAGERLLCYDMKKPCKLWEEQTNVGFWEWDRVGQYVLMMAELEFGVWTTSGEKLWSTFVEPPWNFTVTGDTVELDVLGITRTLRLSDGKPAE